MYFCRYSSSSYITPYSSYISSDGISSHGSYPNIEPYSGYHDLHSAISFDHSDHHIHDGHHYHDISSDHNSHDASYALSSASLLPNTDNLNIDVQGGPNPADMNADTSQTYRRVGKHRKRRQANKQYIPYAKRVLLTFFSIGHIC